MDDLLLRMFSVDTTDREFNGWELLPLDPAIAQGWIVALAVAAVLVTVLAYRWAPSELGWPRRVLLAGLRLAFFALLILILLKPGIRFKMDKQERKTLIVLADVSESMGLADLRVEPDDLKRVAIAKGELTDLGGTLTPLQELAFERVPRIEVAQAALQNEKIGLLSGLGEKFDLAHYRFGNGLDPGKSSAGNATAQGGTDWVENLRALQTDTLIGASVKDAIDKHSPKGNTEKVLGDRVSGILLITDGLESRTSKPVLDVMKQFRGRGDGVPVYIYGVGITVPRDIRIESPGPPETVIKGDPVSVRFSIPAKGLDGRKVVVQLIERNLDSLVEGGSGVRVATSREIEIGKPHGDSLSYIPKKDGKFDLEVRVLASSDVDDPSRNSLKEANIENNHQHHRLEVIDPEKRPIRVLLVDKFPRWEFRYLFEMLRRDQRMKLEVVLFEGHPSIVKNETTNTDSPFLKEFPDEEKLREYDVVILGDVPPGKLDEVDGQQSLYHFVRSFGGRLVVVAGKQHFPREYSRSELSKLLPVQLKEDPPDPGAGAEEYGSTEIRLARSDAGRNGIHRELLSLAEQNEDKVIWGETDDLKGQLAQGEIDRLKRDIDPLPPVFWVADVEESDPAKTLVVVDDGNKGKRFDQHPVIALHKYGNGEVLYVGTDNLWRWRRNEGDVLYNRFWAQIIQHLALPRMTDFSREFRLSVKRDWMVGQDIRVEAEFFEEEMKGATEAKVYFRDGAGKERPLILRRSQDDQRTFSGTIPAKAAGNYRLYLEGYSQDPRYFTVVDNNEEKKMTALNVDLLEKLASDTGGGFYREGNLANLNRDVDSDFRRVPDPREKRLWSTLPWFLLLLLVITCEWVIRKLSYLK